MKWDKRADPQFSKTASKCLKRVPFEVLMIPSISVTVYSFLGVTEFSSHPLEPWQRPFRKMPEQRGVNTQCGRAQAQGAQIPARSPVSTMRAEARARLRHTRRTRNHAHATHPDAEPRGGGPAGALIHHSAWRGQGSHTPGTSAVLRGCLPALGGRRAAG